MSHDVQRFYDGLPPRWKTRFNDSYDEHPDWTDPQRASFIEVMMKIEGEWPPKTPPEQFLKEIMNKVSQFLQVNFPEIYNSVRDYIANVSRKLSQYVNAAWETFKDILDDIFI